MTNQAAWMTYCPHDGWEEYETEEQARAGLDGIVDMLRDEASDAGWYDSAGQARLVKVEVVAELVLRTTATAEDDSPEGELCRDRGWDYIWDGTVEEVTS